MPTLRRALLTLLLTLLSGMWSGAQPLDPSQLGEAAEIVTATREVRPKQVILIFDVSSSMKDTNLTGGSDDMMRRARNAALTIVKEAVRPNDRVVVYTFGAESEKVLEKEYQTPDTDRKEIAAAIPSQPEPGQGTNIRRPHHEALKLAEAYQAGKTFIVLLTDSFNDSPAQGTPAWNDYTRYYVPMQLTKYPATPENQDYERLLQAGVATTYGVGVKVDTVTNRPIERDPSRATLPTPTPAVEATPAPVNETPQTKNFPFLPFLIGIVPLIGLGMWWMLSTKPVALRVTGGAAGQRDFQVRSNPPLRLGGVAGGFAADAYPVPGAKDAVATIKGSRGQLMITPAAQLPTGLRVYHNGLPLEVPTKLSYGDEVRISVPDTEIGIPKEIRLKFSDPSKAF